LESTLTYAIGNIGWLFVFSLGWFMHDHTRQQKLLEAVQKKQMETELHFLKNQVNPHFLFNTLNNLYGLSLKNSDKGPDAILRLSSILRYMLYESNAQLVSFEREKEIMNAYIELELLRLPAGEDFHFNIEADRAYSIPPLLWLPVLENVFKHATRVIATHYFVDFRFVIKDNIVEIYSKNNYKAGAKTNGDAGGIGLDNSRKRLALLYPGRHKIETGKDEEYYTVQIKIELV
jgi:two-component system LytT family sensor kinase